MFVLDQSALTGLDFEDLITDYAPGDSVDISALLGERPDTGTVDDVVLPEIGTIGASIAEVLDRLVDGLVVRSDRMRHNLDPPNGLIVSEAAMMQMSGQIGPHHAHELLY